MSLTLYILQLYCALHSEALGQDSCRRYHSLWEHFGLFNATVLMSSTSELLKRYLDWDETAISVTAFIVIMVLSIIAISLAVYVVSWILKLLGLNIFNRIAGALLSAFVTLLIVTAIIDLTSLVAPDNSITSKTIQEKSVLYNKVVNDIYKKTITRLF